MKFFYLQKSDRQTIVLLLCVIVVAIAVFTVTDGQRENPQSGKVITEKKDSQVRKDHRHQSYYQEVARKPELFSFDPNTADSTQLLRLGLQPWQVRNIYKYRAAGGIYRKPRDFAKLYGLTLKQYRQLEPYIKISEDYMPASDYYDKREPKEERDTLKHPVKLKAQERVVLNTADTALLRQVPGIGSYFARRIVEYRERLGGYYRIQQLSEIDGFPESALSYFVIPDETALRKININRLSLNELKRHPYINFYQARDIVDYRRLRGPIESLQQLRLLKDFSPESIERLEPYVEY